MREIYLIRHGETEWNASGRFQGQLDSPLTDRGREQAAACGQKMLQLGVELDVFVASPLGRTRQTALTIGQIAAFPEPRFDQRLVEVSTGAWDGLTHIDIDAQWPERLDGSTPFDWYFRSPDGESYEAAFARASGWLAGLDGVIVAVSHGLFGRIIRGAYLDLPKEEALTLPVPQDVIWRLAENRIEAIATD
jgi:probable phosphoglycerate mutase